MSPLEELEYFPENVQKSLGDRFLPGSAWKAYSAPNAIAVFDGIGQ